MTGKYDDMLFLPHHVSAGRPHLSPESRAAQFSPFAALTGYDAAVRETARVTDSRQELDDGTKEVLNGRLQLLAERLEDHPEVTVTFFRPDAKKEGGSYAAVTGSVKKIDEYEKTVVMTDGTKIPVEEITEIAGEVFNRFL